MIGSSKDVFILTAFGGELCYIYFSLRVLHSLLFCFFLFNHFFLCVFTFGPIIVIFIKYIFYTQDVNKQRIAILKLILNQSPREKVQVLMIKTQFNGRFFLVNFTECNNRQVSLMTSCINRRLLFEIFPACRHRIYDL